MRYCVRKNKNSFYPIKKKYPEGYCGGMKVCSKPEMIANNVCECCKCDIGGDVDRYINMRRTELIDKMLK